MSTTFSNAAMDSPTRNRHPHETFKGRAIVRWQLLPTVSHQSVSEGQWKEYYEERETIELDGLGANRPTLTEPEIDLENCNPRAVAILESVRGGLEEILSDCGYGGISYARSIHSLVYLLPFTGERDGSDPRTITIASVFYSPHETINYLTLSYELHHNDKSSTLSCELSDKKKIALVDITDVHAPGGATLRRQVTMEELTRIRHFVFGDNALVTAWKMFEILLCASAIESLGEDMGWLLEATRSGLVTKMERSPEVAQGPAAGFKSNFFDDNAT